MFIQPTYEDHGHGVKTRVVSSRIHVICPYNEAFILAAYSVDGRWRRRSQIWSFNRVVFPKIARSLNAIFGTRIRVQATTTGE